MLPRLWQVWCFDDVATGYFGYRIELPRCPSEDFLGQWGGGFSGTSTGPPNQLSFIRNEKWLM